MNGTTVFFDFETGGVEPARPNIQLAAVAVRDWAEVEAFEAKIAFDVAACDPAALELVGYDAARWAKAEPEASVARRFRDFLARHADLRLVSKRGSTYSTCRLAGHNVATFDAPRLRAMMDAHLAGAFWPGCWWYPLDTYQRAIWYFTERGLALPDKFTLQALAAHFGISVASAHDALSDVRTCAALARVLVGSPGA